MSNNFMHIFSSHVQEKIVLDDDEDISGNPEDMDDAEDMVETKVAAGKKLKLEYQIDQPQTQIW